MIHKRGSNGGARFGKIRVRWNNATRVNFDHVGEATNSINAPNGHRLPAAAQTTTIGVSRGWPHVDTFGWFQFSIYDHQDFAI